MKKLNLTILLIFISSLSQASDFDYPADWLVIGMDNDFVFQTDRYYTNGLKIEYFIKGRGPSLLDYLHLKDNPDEKAFYGFSISQGIFTPEDKNSVARQLQDRPFASSLIFSSSKIITNNQKRLIRQSEFQIGLVGKLGGGEWVQNGIHGILPTSSIVTGWENQIKTDIALNYGLEYEKQITGGQLFQINGMLGGKIGLPYTYAVSGFNFRIGNIDKYFNQLNFYSANKIDFFFYSGIKGRVVAYNATIQGGLFSNANLNYPDINHFLYEFDTGINLSYQSFKLNLGVKLISPEMKNGKNHRWGYMSFMFAL
jgi:hypothetical protein